MQCVILAGGLGTRLGHLVADRPKPMLAVAGRPFLDHLIDHFSRFGFDRFCILAGHKAEIIRAHYACRPEISVLTEPAPMGTGGALRFAAESLDDRFLMVNGDTLFDFNVLDLVSAPGNAIARIALCEVPDGSRFGVVVLDASGAISEMKERPDHAGPALINSGVYWLDRTILMHIPDGPSSIERDIFPALARSGLLHGQPYRGFFLDIGVPNEFQRAQEFLPIRRPAVFFDRDGVLNKDGGYTSKASDFEWMPGAKAAIRRFNDAGWFVFVVTNQSGVARGFYAESDVQALHDWMSAELSRVGAHIDAFRFCPHHKDGTVPEYARSCSWRKPGSGMIRNLLQKWPVDVLQSILIGDTESDLAAAADVGLRGLRFDGGDLLQFCDHRVWPDAVGSIWTE